MKKIGIITFHRAENYGAVLQAYALVRTMCEMGADCEVVNFCSESIYNVYKPIKWTGETLKMRFAVLKKSVQNLPYSLRKKRYFTGFVKKYIPVSAPVTERTISRYADERYSALIAGSDQVFSSYHTKKDLKNYLLGFAPKSISRYSYAASVGTHIDRITEEDKELYKSEWLKFKGLSIRESNGAALVKELTGRDASMHIDPTLLVRAEQWSEISTRDTGKTPYIFMYMMYNSSAAFDDAQKLSEQMGLPVVCLLGSVRQEKKASFPGLTYICDCSPEKFLGLVQDASYVLTTSFHGTAFSILFQKPFIAYSSKKNKNDDRVKTLLQLTGLEKRMWSPGFNKTETIDWNDVESRLALERKRAKDYLSSIIE